MKRPVITLLTDFGSAGPYPGAMKGVMLGICPDAQLADISHEISPWSVPEAAFTLAQTWHYFPHGTVHLIVVDPGVGGTRRPIIAKAGGHLFVAPDNGVLTMIFDSSPGHIVRNITASRYFRKPVSHTFHGRDIFAPVAAWAARGELFAKFGKKIDDYVRLNFGRPKKNKDGTLSGSVLQVDRFGNVITNFVTTDWPDLNKKPFELRAGRRSITRLASSYSEVQPGELFLIGGSAGYLEISLNQENAAKALDIAPGASIQLRT
jgi:S-adenosylmethionine hydrolase